MLQTVFALACLISPSPKPAALRGWMIHGTDRAYMMSVLAAAKRYGINHLEIAGNNPTFSEEFVQYPRQTALIEEISKLGKQQGLNVYVWIREFNVRTRDLKTDPSTPEGQAFWQGRQDALRSALKMMPSLSGVVMSYGSTPTEIWHVQGDAFWQGMSQPERIRFTTEKFRDVAVGEFHKKMFVRDFNHAPDQLHWLVEGLKDESGITMHSKAEPQDWQFFYPHSFSQGAYGKTPQVVEFDLAGEYWGCSLVPVSLVEYFKYRWTYDESKGARGVVGRIDRDNDRALGSPSEINLYAHSILLEHPETSAQAIYDQWNAKRYGLQPGTAASRLMTEVYRRCTQVVKLQYYTLGFWTPKAQTSIADSMRSIESTIKGKSTAQWDPTKEPTEKALLDPTPDTVTHIMKDKAEAVRLANLNLSEFAALTHAMKPADYRAFSAQLTYMRDQAAVWESMSAAFWKTKLAQKGAVTKEEAMVAVDMFSSLLASLKNPDAPRFVGAIQRSGQKLAGDMRNRLSEATKATEGTPEKQ